MLSALTDRENIVPVLMIAAGFLLVLIGLIGAMRLRRSEENQEDEFPDQPRPRMAPLPRLLSADRTEHEKKSDAG